MIDIKPGDRYRRKGETDPSAYYSEFVVRAVGLDYPGVPDEVWVQFTTGPAEYHVREEMSPVYIERNFAKVGSFFEVGKSYTWDTHHSEYTYEVIDIGEYGSKYAIAKMSHLGTPLGVKALGEGLFSNFREI